MGLRGQPTQEDARRTQSQTGPVQSSVRAQRQLLRGMLAGRVGPRQFEYRRHGTQTLQVAEHRPDRTLGYQIEIWLSILARKAFAAATSPPTRTPARRSRSPSPLPTMAKPLGWTRPQDPCGWADESYNSIQMDEAECRVYCQTLRRSLKACLSAELRQPPPATAMRALLSSRTALGAEGGMHRWWASRQGISLFFVPSNA
jgi:hypothetical protein